jgi:hypothetical protein
MLESLPFADFRWITFTNDFTHQDLLDAVEAEQKPDSSRGAFVEVDIEYPLENDELCRLHSDLPCCPEQRECSEPSPSQRRIQELLGKKCISGKKLVAHLMKRERYVLHTRALALYLRLGMRVTKVHRAVTFRQKPWMRRYVEMNARLRQAATNSFERDHYKLMVNLKQV